MVTRLRPAAWCSGHSGMTATSATQFGLAITPRCAASAAAFTSGTTSGVSWSMRKAEELSTTIAPAAAAIGANSREVPAPAEKKATSTPSKAPLASVSTRTGLPLNSSSRPAERADARSRSVPTGKPRRSSWPISSAPTAPVAPTMATVNGRLRASRAGISRVELMVVVSGLEPAAGAFRR
jgi:hypothetical protein